MTHTQLTPMHHDAAKMLNSAEPFLDVCWPLLAPLKIRDSTN